MILFIGNEKYFLESIEIFWIPVKYILAPHYYGAFPIGL